MRFLLGLLLLVPVSVSAQTVTLNPTTVDIPASPDHAATFGGTALVTKYELVIVRQATPTTPVTTTDLGKPTPTANVITVPVPSGLPNNTVLQAFYRVVGPGGASASALSDPFGAVGAPAVGGKPTLKP